MSFPQNNEYLELSKGVLKRLHDSGDLLELKRDDLLKAFNEIEQYVIGKNTSETIASARNDVMKQANHKAELDFGCYQISSESGARFQEQAIKITEGLAVTLEVLIRMVKELKNADVLKQVNLQVAQGAQPFMVDTSIQHPGFWQRISDWFGRVDAQQRAEFEKAVALLEQELLEVKQTKTLWIRWTKQRMKMIKMANYYSRDGKDFNFMHGFLLQEIGDLWDMRARVLPILAAGFNIHDLELQKLFTELAGEMTRQVAQQNVQPFLNPTLPISRPGFEIQK